jgi:hypothetical protein
VPTPAERDEHRTKLLLAIYDMLGGRRMQMDDFRKAVAAANIDVAGGADAAQWLVDHGLIEWAALGGQVELTAAGIDEAERLVRESQTAAVEVVILDQTQRGEVEAVLHQLEVARSSGGIAVPTPEDEAELDADLRTIEVQSRSPRPKRDAVLGALRGISDFLTRPVQAGVVSGALVLAVQTAIHHLA